MYLQALEMQMREFDVGKMSVERWGVMGQPHMRRYSDASNDLEKHEAYHPPRAETLGTAAKITD